MVVTTPLTLAGQSLTLLVRAGGGAWHAHPPRARDQHHWMPLADPDRARASWKLRPDGD